VSRHCFFQARTKPARSSIFGSDMRRALPKLAIFLLVLLALDRLLYIGATYLRDTGWHPRDVDLVYERHWDPAIVFFGDSRTKHNFDMRIVESSTGLSAFNLGRESASTAETLLILEEYLKHGHRPHIVVFEADVRSLWVKMGKFETAFFRDRLPVIPDLDEMLGDAHLTIQRRASIFAVNWMLRSSSFPNRLPDLWRNWREREQSGSGENEQRCDLNDDSKRCLNYHGSQLFRPMKESR
jgi:hypothetical protein